MEKRNLFLRKTMYCNSFMNCSISKSVRTFREKSRQGEEIQIKRAFSKHYGYVNYRDCIHIHPLNSTFLEESDDDFYVGFHYHCITLDTFDDVSNTDEDAVNDEYMYWYRRQK